MTLEEQGKKIMRVATKKPLSGAELVAKLNAKLPSGQSPYSTRGISRALGQLVKSGQLVRAGGANSATYAKP